MKTNILTAFLLLLPTSLLFAAAPGEINYQGKLSDNSGNPVTGTRNITVAIYDDGPSVSGGTKYFEETHGNVSVANGVFNLQIGAGVLASGNLKAALGADAAWLQITVGASVMSPRQKLASVPYALSVATGAITNESVAAGAGITADKLAPGTLPEGHYGIGGTGGRLTNLQDPVSAQDAATMHYTTSAIASALDGGMGGVGIKTSTLTANYSVFMATLSGGVGIGTLDPGAFKLKVNGSMDATFVTQGGQTTPQFIARQGYNDTNWNIGGTTNYFPAAARVQAGSYVQTITAAATGNVTLTFPTAFNGNPILLVTPNYPNSNGSPVKWLVRHTQTTATTFTVTWYTADGGTCNQIQFFWMAVGP